MDARFDLQLPGSCAEAPQLLASDGAIPLAGGTNVVVDLRARRGAAEELTRIAPRSPPDGALVS